MPFVAPFSLRGARFGGTRAFFLGPQNAFSCYWSNIKPTRGGAAGRHLPKAGLGCVLVVPVVWKNWWAVGPGHRGRRERGVSCLGLGSMTTRPAHQHKGLEGGSARPTDGFTLRLAASEGRHTSTAMVGGQSVAFVTLLGLWRGRLGRFPVFFLALRRLHSALTYHNHYPPSSER